MSWFVYILRCGDGTLYTGVTDDVQRRLAAQRALPYSASRRYFFAFLLLK